jgi:hypothetical protein
VPTCKLPKDRRIRADFAEPPANPLSPLPVRSL